MASSMWSALEQAQSAAGGGIVTAAGGTLVGSGGGGLGDPMWLSNLSSALNVGGDAEFFEESISPSTIRNSLSTADPSNPTHTSTLLRGMKWLLANISKGRDVSDFYPHVVKLVQAVSLEVRKMVYLYLVQYADYSPTTRELSLLSINSFQRGLGDPEQWIRGLALRVLTSIRLPDILQIQILAAQKSSSDTSPYVRKCAANAMVKLYRAQGINRQQQEIIVELLVDLLHQEDCTMVLTSALIAFAQLSLQLHFLHHSFRKICHLLTDMDEWGQVVVLDLLTRYCRTYFRQPPIGSAEQIDRQRRVVGGGGGGSGDHPGTAAQSGVSASPRNVNTTSTGAPLKFPTNSTTPAVKVRRRVVRKGFYSDEEDTSTEEEVYENNLGHVLPSVSHALRENPAHDNHNNDVAPGVVKSKNVSSLAESELEQLAPDHRLLLTSALPLLKSRNAGVVLGVSALAYYCGVASIPTRVAVGKALVRISRDKREIQFVVLTSIRTLAAECPSAFTPYLSDFFISAMDPGFTKLIKLDILTLLALEPSAIERVLSELRTYAIGSDSNFAKVAIQSVGKVVEMARKVHDRHGWKHQTVDRAREQANVIALDCLFGLVTLSILTSDKPIVVGECVMVMQRILQLLNAADTNVHTLPVQDPNQVQSQALKRILVLVVGSLSQKKNSLPTEDDNDSSTINGDENTIRIQRSTPKPLPPYAVASGLWILGEFFCLPSFMPSAVTVLGSDERVAAVRLELIRLVAKSFPDLDACEKEQGIHLSSKILVCHREKTKDCAVAEHILAMGRLDVNPDVKDRARFESGLLHLSVVLQHDLDALDAVPSDLPRKLTPDHARQILLRRKPASDSLVGSAVNAETYRFGTLSSLVGHRARSAYVPLPPWADADSPDSLREPQGKPSRSGRQQLDSKAESGSFYNSSSSSSENTTDDSSNSSSVASEKSDAMESSSSSDEWSEDNDSVRSDGTSSSDSSEDDSDDGISKNSSDSDNDSAQFPSSAEGNLLSLGSLGRAAGPSTVAGNTSTCPPRSTSTEISEDLKGLVLAPIPVNAADEPKDFNLERDSSSWLSLVRPDLAGGLSVRARYLRGATKQIQCQLMNLAAATERSVVCLQVRFENQKQAPTGSGTFRRLSIQQKGSSGTSSTIGPQKLVPPPQIAELTPGQQVDTFLGIQFSGVSDRDGSLVAKIDVKFGTSSIPVDIKPNLGELLLPPPKPLTPASFDSTVTRLQGFQRLETSFKLENSNASGSLVDAATILSTSLIRHVALVPVGGLGNSKTGDSAKLRFMGTLPAAGDPVFVQLTFSTPSFHGRATVCCDHPLAVNSIMNQVKTALQGL